jgi:hypothetical protein
MAKSKRYSGSFELHVVGGGDSSVLSFTLKDAPVDSFVAHLESVVAQLKEIRQRDTKGRFLPKRIKQEG